MENKLSAENIYLENIITNTSNKLNTKLTHNGVKYYLRNDVDYLKSFIDEFLKEDTPNRYIVMPGIRGVGKTVILHQIYEYILKEKNINYKNILLISLEKINNMSDSTLLEVIELYLDKYFNKSLDTLDEKVFILIDEAQYDPKWSMTGKIIYDSNPNIFTIFTGSSAIELEYNADSARRLIKIPINPLNYTEHIKLKYNYILPEISNALVDAIFNRNLDDAQKIEQKITNTLPEIKEYYTDDWNSYLKYGGFPSTFYKNNELSTKSLITTIERVIDKDMSLIKDVSRNTKNFASRLLYLLAQQKPGEISQNRIGDYLDCPVSTIKNITNILEKTHLIFHLEPYSSSSKRVRVTWKYYFATPSIRHTLNLDMGIVSTDIHAYNEILLENYVASALFNLKNKRNIYFNTFYDSMKKGGVDFLIQRGFENPIPIEVGIGKKTKKQVYMAMTNYGSEYGIIVSDATMKIKEEDEIIYIPYKTFTYL